MIVSVKRFRGRAVEFRSGEQGFTIIELMIALSILSLILVISSVVLINLGVLYTKGNNQANTQNVTRNIVNELASQLELGGADPVMATGAGTHAICLGSQRYTYASGQLGAQTQHALWRDTLKSSSAQCVPADFTLANPDDPSVTDVVTNSGTELLQSQMQLVDLSVTGLSSGTYSIQVTVAYGDPTLLIPGTNGGAPHCTGDKGTEYCAVSSLTQTVAQRVHN